MLVTGTRHLSYEERLQRLGLHSLQRRQLRADLITAFKIFKGFWILIQTCFSFLPLDAAYEGTPSRYSKVGATAKGEGQHFRWGLWNTGIPPSGYSSLFPSPPLTEQSPHLPSPLHNPPPLFFPPPHQLLTLIISIRCLTSCFMYVVSSGQFWPKVNHYKS